MRGDEREVSAEKGGGVLLEIADKNSGWQRKRS